MVHWEPGQTGYAGTPYTGPDLKGSFVSKLLCLHPPALTFPARESRAIDTPSPRRAWRGDGPRVCPGPAPNGGRLLLGTEVLYLQC
jgi:hypothetical protein